MLPSCLHHPCGDRSSPGLWPLGECGDWQPPAAVPHSTPAPPPPALTAGGRSLKAEQSGAYLAWSVPATRSLRSSCHRGTHGGTATTKYRAQAAGPGRWGGRGRWPQDGGPQRAAPESKQRGCRRGAAEVGVGKQVWALVPPQIPPSPGPAPCPTSGQRKGTTRDQQTARPFRGIHIHAAAGHVLSGATWKKAAV